jgi:hypothetical protein
MNKLVKAFAVIGVISTLFVLGMVIETLFVDGGPPQKSGRCLTEGSVVRLDSYFDDRTDYYYELIAQTTGFHDKVTYVKLLKGQYGASSPDCIEADKVVSEVDLYWGAENEPATQWPKSISVTNERIEIEYTESQAEGMHLANLPIIWGF